MAATFLRGGAAQSSSSPEPLNLSQSAASLITSTALAARAQAIHGELLNDVQPRSPEQILIVSTSRHAAGLTLGAAAEVHLDFFTASGKRH